MHVSTIKYEINALIQKALQNSKLKGTYSRMKETIRRKISGQPYDRATSVEEERVVNEFMDSIDKLHAKNESICANFEKNIRDGLQETQRLILAGEDQKDSLRKLMDAAEDFETWLQALLTDYLQAEKKVGAVLKWIPAYEVKLRPSKHVPKPIDEKVEFGSNKARIIVRYEAPFDPQETLQILEEF